MLQIRAVHTLLLVCFLAGHSFADIGRRHNPGADNVLPYYEGRILVKTVDESPVDALDTETNRLGADLVSSYTIVPGLRLYHYDASIDVAEAIQVFSANEFVEYAEPDYLYQTAVQNDLRFPEQWALENDGQTGGTADADINANLMWQLEDGDSSVVIGVIDSGIDYNHDDLVPNLWQNALEIPGTGLDEDLNGYVDDVYGINAITNSGDPIDDNAHGTHVAGTIGARGNNAIGIVGVAQDVKIATCKFLGSGGTGATSDAIQCMQYFANLKTRLLNPVNIVATNNSWGSTSKSTAMMDAIKSHQNLGILFVAAAGNNAINNDVTPYYPASYDVANIISVAATDHNDQLATFSNYGKKTVHVGAPGVRILSTVLNQSYSLFSGTSMAAPHVTGLVAVLKARFPTLDYRNVKNLVIAGGTPLATLQSTTITGRRIRGADTNGTGSLSCSNQVVDARLQPLASTQNVSVGSSIFLSALRVNCDVPSGPITLFSDGNQNIILQDSGTAGDVTINDGVYSLLWQPQIPGVYPLDFGNGDVVTVTVTQPLIYQVINNLPYEYQTITGTSLNAGDETIHVVTTPFPIRFNNDPAGFTKIYVSSNGTISFTTATNPGYINRTLPTTVATTMVAAFWDDLLPSGTNSNVYVATVGTAPNRKFVVEWRNLRHYNASGLGTFQAVFYENSSDIRINYADTNFSSTTINSGASATAGVQSSATTAKLYSYNAANLPSLSSLLYRLQ